MKKSLMAILAAALVGAAWAEDTSADVLVWYLDTNEDMEHSGSEFDTIKFWAVDVNDSNHKIDLADRTYVTGQDLVESSSAAGTGDTISVPNEVGPTSIWGEYYTNLSGLDTGYSFWMELYLGETKVDRMLQPVTWEEFQGHMIASSGIGEDFNLPDNVELYNFASSMIPEPSSGLLFLMGGALLALRRRRVA